MKARYQSCVIFTTKHAKLSSPKYEFVLISVDFIDGFAESLSKFDELLLLDIYPARELPIEGVTSKWLLEKIKNPNKQLISKSELIDEIKKSDAQVILTIGAGDIGEEVKHIKEAFSVAN